jgi:Lon protease-like protein
MRELPLFPLNTVLFPGTPLHLHIFEERYKQMIAQCIQNKEAFGVVLIRHGLEAFGPLADPHRIGCSAKIIHTHKTKKNRMNIVALGLQRFRILSLDRESYPYLVGEIKNYPMRVQDSQNLIQVRERLHPLVERYIRLLMEAAENQPDLEELPKDPIWLANMAAAVLQISPAQKQAFLSVENADKFLIDLYEIYRREVALLERMVSREPASDIGSFSIN